METPNASQQPAPAAPETVLTFKPVQQETLDAIFAQMGELERQANALISYFIREAGLPQMPPGSYGLAADRKGVVCQQPVTMSLVR